MDVMQNVRQRFDPRTHAMRRSSMLAASDTRMPSTHFPTTLPALAYFHRIAVHLRLRLRRYVRSRNHLAAAFSQFPTAIRATSFHHWHGNRFDGPSRFWRAAKPEETLPRFPSRWLRVSFAFALRKWGRPAPPLQLLNLCLQSPVHALQLEDDLNQLFSAEIFQLSQDPGCTTSCSRACSHYAQRLDDERE
jgi:hypothetical protein